MSIRGLTSSEVQDRQKEGLVNKISKSRTKTIPEIIIENVFSLFNFIILGIIAFVIIFYFRSYDNRLLLDSVGIMLVAVINTFIAIYQEIKAKHALDKVNLLLKRNVTVIRNGINVEIEQSEIVKDEIIIVNRGDQIVVDGRVVKSEHLEIDESLLTGESMPVPKSKNDSLFSGSFCIAGSGYYIAEKVGNESYAFEITNLARKYKFNLTPLQKKLNFFLKTLFGFALLLVLFKVILGNIKDVPEVDFVREIATILSSLVPQGLILTASVTYALGVYRISKIGAIIQKLNAVESFSNVRVVCMDKTGTLTQNKLHVAAVTPLDENLPLNNIEILIGTFVRNSIEKNATSNSMENFPSSDDYIKLDEIPFSSSVKFSAVKFEFNNEKIIYILGGLDVLEDKTGSGNLKIIKHKYQSLGLNIYRNLLFGKVTGTDNLQSLKSGNPAFDILPLAIISISDTVRDDVLDAVNLFKNNGITFKILSGDSSESIKAIMKEIGWETGDDKFITGKEFESVPDNQLKDVILGKEVFSRLKPEHKLKIIKTLKNNNIYTAMLGDGVNDLPAIKEAALGIAMEEGSAITKEVADIVLLKNKFSLLPEIFDEGNKIVNSVSSVSKLFLTKNFIVIYLTILSYMTFIYPLTPRRVSLLNIFAIGLPALIITVKNINKDKMKNFLPDVISYVLISAAVITAFGYAGFFLADLVTSDARNILDFTMMAVLIVMAVFNFIIVSGYTKAPESAFRLYGFGLIVFFFFLTAINFDIKLFKIVKVFYEINTLGIIEFLIVAFLGTAGFFVLRFADKKRLQKFKR